MRLLVLFISLLLSGQVVAQNESCDKVPVACYEGKLVGFLQAWADARTSGDLQGYLSTYFPNRSPQRGLDYDDWITNAREKLRSDRGSRIVLQLDSMMLTTSGDVHVYFIQEIMRSEGFERQAIAMQLLPTEDGYMIIDEVSANSIGELIRADTQEDSRVTKVDSPD